MRVSATEVAAVPNSTLLAIDVGTSHTVAVVQRAGRPPQPLLFDGSPILPSGVFGGAEGAVHTGRDAERLAQVEPHRFEPHPKRRIDEGTVLLGDAEFGVPQLLGAILQRVVREAAHAGSGSVILTCPADFGRWRRGVLLEAARLAGIPAPTLVDEPVAAAAYCAQVLRMSVPYGQALLVFDFGGGTLDLALVRSDPAGPRIVGVSGLEDLGGLDVDAALVGHLGHLIATRDPALWRRLTQPSGAHELRDRRAFWAEVRAAKEMLSRTTSAPVALPGAAEPMYLTREELERLAGPLVDRAVDETRRLLDGTGIGASGVAGILLVGGSSRIPLVATRLHSRLGIAPVVPEQPELPVAFGALAVGIPGGADPTTESNALPVSSVPAPVSGGRPAPVSAAPVSGDPSWQQPYWTPQSGAPPGPPYPAPHPTPPARSRLPLVLGVVAIVLVLGLGLGGWVMWQGINTPGKGQGQSPGGAAGAAGVGASPAAQRPDPPTDFAYCEGPPSRLLCPTVPACYDADDDETPCDGEWSTQLFAAGILPSDATELGSEAVAKRPEVKAACSEAVMGTRSVDKNRTKGWAIYSQWVQVNGVNRFYCLAGPRNDATTKGSAFRTG